MADGPRYEFTPQQNQTINGLAHTMRSVSAVIILIGFSCFLLGSFQLMGSIKAGQYAHINTATIQLLLGVLFLLMGTSLHSSGSLLKKIVDTYGNDVSLLIEALDKLSGTFSVCLWLIAITGVVILAMLAVPRLMGG